MTTAGTRPRATAYATGCHLGKAIPRGTQPEKGEGQRGRTGSQGRRAPSGTARARRGDGAAGASRQGDTPAELPVPGRTPSSVRAARFQLGTMHASRPCPALSSHGEEGAGRTAGGPQGLGHSAGSAGTRPGCGAAAARQAPWLTRPCQPDSTVSLPTQVWTRVSQPPPRGAGRARGPLPVLAVPLERPFSPRFCGGGGLGEARGDRSRQ